MTARRYAYSSRTAPTPGEADEHSAHERSAHQRSAYDQGLQAGEQAARSAPAPFSEEQLAWLCGFVSGLGATPHSTIPPSPASASPTHPVSPSYPASASSLGSQPTPIGVDRHVDRDTDPAAQPMAERSADKYGRDNPYAARVLELTPITTERPRSWHLVLDIEGSGITCGPGDLLGVFPGNEPDLVRNLLRLLGARGQENVTTRQGSAPAWRALLEELDLRLVTRELVKLMAARARQRDDAAELNILLNKRELPTKSVLDMLQDFPSARPSLAEFVTTLSPLAPEYVPISASRALHADTLEALASPSSDLEPRSGGLFHRMAKEQLKPGDWLSVYVHRQEAGRPPTDPDAPVILLAHDACAACARAFLQERHAAGARGRNWLFLSQSGEGLGPHYAQELATWQASRLLTRLDVAAPGFERLLERLESQFDMIERWLLDNSLLYVFAEHALLPNFMLTLSELIARHSGPRDVSAAERVATMQNIGQLRLISA